MEACELCGHVGKLEKHHLVPQSKCHSAKHSKKLKTDESNFLWVCKNCHDQIHAFFTNNELRDLYATKELLLADVKIQKYLEWRKKHLDYDFSSSKMSAQQKRRR